MPPQTKTDRLNCGEIRTLLVKYLIVALFTSPPSSHCSNACQHGTPRGHAFIFFWHRTSCFNKGNLF